ncbi:hypothetical protein GTW25_14095 [Aliihoeflea aestuarii]|nr:hypothetical protein [Aliihoeflea aestuarii]MCO6392161.1 hypothetical protein [Aliihoeflea aestuarii]
MAVNPDEVNLVSAAMRAGLRWLDESDMRLCQIPMAARRNWKGERANE